MELMIFLTHWPPQLRFQRSAGSPGGAITAVLNGRRARARTRGRHPRNKMDDDDDDDDDDDAGNDDAVT